MSFVKNSKDLSSSSATKEIFKTPNQTFSNIQNQWVLTTQQRNAAEFTEHSKCSAVKPHFILKHQQVPHSGDSACVLCTHESECNPNSNVDSRRDDTQHP